ncbi:MAG: phosphodiester glycosidase family protein, partial [Jatrophihabitantaceae bacterium]
RGRHATASVAFTTAHIATLVSGARVVLRGGVPVDDPTARAIQGQHAETFACVSQDARHLLFGAVDMLYWWQESGVSLVQLRYYLQQLGCWTAIELDGGGSSTLDYRMPGSTQVVTVNHPADGSERWIPDALLVYRH